MSHIYVATISSLTLTGVSSRGPHGPILMHGHGLLAITYDVHIRTRQCPHAGATRSTPCSRYGRLSGSRDYTSMHDRALDKSHRRRGSLVVSATLIELKCTQLSHAFPYPARKYVNEVLKNSTCRFEMVSSTLS